MTDLVQVTCTLDARVQHVISLICSLKHMERTVTDMKYDAYKNPLGKILIRREILLLGGGIGWLIKLSRSALAQCERAAPGK